MKTFRHMILILLAVIFFVPQNLATAEELVFWNFWDAKFILPVIEEFERENPGIKIRNEQLNWGNGLDKIVVAMANNRPPDICELGSTWMSKFMSEDVLLDLTESFKHLKDDYLMWEPATWQGRIYGMPWLAGTRVLFYNRQLFAQAGLDANKPPITWSEMLQAARAIHNPAQSRFGFGINAGEGHILYKKFMPFVWGNGGKIIDEAGNFTFDSPQTRAALDFHLNLKQYSYSEKQDLLDEAFKQGKLGMTISGSWNLNRYRLDAPNLDFGVALLPRPKNDQGFSTSFLGGQILVIFKTSPQQQMAKKFIRHLSAAENTMPITKEALISFPANKEAYKHDFFTTNQHLRVFVEQMKTAIHPPIHPLWIEMERIINDTVERVMYGESADLLLSKANKEFERVSSRYERNRSSRLADFSQKDSKSSGNMQTVLLALIAAGTLFNAILLTFLLVEVKKNAG